MPWPLAQNPGDAIASEHKFSEISYYAPYLNISTDYKQFPNP